MYNLVTQGMLPVEDLNALFNERLRVKLPGGLYTITSRTYSCDCGAKVYEHRLPLVMSIRFRPVGRKVANFAPAPSVRAKDKN